MLVLTSAAAATEARLLVQRGLHQRDAPPTATSDIMLTTPHGAQAFLLLRGDADTSSIIARAATATRAARRCTILWLGERIQHGAVMALQDDWCVPRARLRVVQRAMAHHELTDRHPLPPAEAALLA